MKPRNPLVTLTTDFGLADGYVGTMKGVILGIAPETCLVDITHQIAPQDVRRAAFVLYSAYPFFPPHTVHLVVVDPGVGSARRAVALRTLAGTFVAPDNGVLTYVLAREPIEALVELAEPRYRLSEISHTFHGRDVFAPAAAYLARGVPVTSLGPPVSDPVTFPLPRLEVGPGVVTGEVLYSDHFGNAITSIGRLVWDGEELALKPALVKMGSGGAEEQRSEVVRFRASEAVVTVAGREIVGVRHTYAEVAPGEALALVGSHGHLEIAVRDGSAMHRLELQNGMPLTLRFGSLARV